MNEARSFDITFNKPTSIDGYIPKNKKLLTKDYNYLVATNESGASEVLAYETFKTSNCRFNFSGIPVPGRKWKINASKLWKCWKCSKCLFTIFNTFWKISYF